MPNQPHTQPDPRHKYVGPLKIHSLVETRTINKSIADNLAILDGIDSDLHKSGGPYIGPRGGKWSDPQHKHAWLGGRKSAQTLGHIKSPTRAHDAHVASGGRQPKADFYHEHKAAKAVIATDVASRESGERLNFWDFDDTLAHSNVAVDAMKEQHPDIATWKFWHDPAVSTVAALNTEPIDSMWAELAATPGEHRILTARNVDAVNAWIDKHRDTIPEIALLSKVQSTSVESQKHIPAPVKKATEIASHVAAGRDVHLYDDNHDNLEHAGNAGATAHLIADGALAGY